MAHTFTTLRHPVERLLEAEYFLGRLTCASDLRFQFELNAFLSASRSVTWVLQKAMAHVPGFVGWYEQKQTQMKSDRAMRFFLQLRNISQKEGPISFVGASLPEGNWTYRFVGRPEAVPVELTRRDIGVCCAEHLAKMATVLLDCVRAFPFHSCPARAMTEEGMVALGYGWRDIEEALGLPPGYTEAGAIPVRERLRLLRGEMEPLEILSIKRIAGGDLRAEGERLEFPASSGVEWLDEMAAIMAAEGDLSSNPRAAFVRATLKHVDEPPHSQSGSSPG